MVRFVFACAIVSARRLFFLGCCLLGSCGFLGSRLFRRCGFLCGCGLLCSSRRCSHHRRGVILQSLGQEFVLDVVDACCIAGVVAQELSRAAAARCCHTLPEGDSHVGVVSGHCGEDESHAVGLGLVVARVWWSFVVFFCI